MEGYISGSRYSAGNRELPADKTSDQSFSGLGYNIIIWKIIISNIPLTNVFSVLNIGD